eukprot:3034713-Pyramimonas_sp.AAC.2
MRIYPHVCSGAKVYSLSLHVTGPPGGRCTAAPAESYCCNCTLHPWSEPSLPTVLLGFQYTKITEVIPLMQRHGPDCGSLQLLNMLNDGTVQPV